MKLSGRDKKYLESIGYSEGDFPQIQEAIGKTEYTCQSKKIRQHDAINILGRRNYLSGVARSAFHWTSSSVAENGAVVYFDSRRMFG